MLQLLSNILKTFDWQGQIQYFLPKKKKIEKRYFIPDFVENVTTALVYENGLVPALCREKVQFTGVNFSITYSH